MKTTIELPDDLLRQAKRIARKRNTTLKSIMEHALRREVQEFHTTPADAEIFTHNEYGFPVIRRDPTTQPHITSEMIYRMIEESEDAP